MWWILPTFVTGLLIYALCGCSHIATLKDCSKVEGTDYFVCKTLKPWE